MPTYDYECSACDYRGEVFQKITDEPLKKCPSCGKAKLVRLFGTGAAIVFKGSGFYQTDYRSDSYRKAAESDSKAAQSSSSDAGSKSDSSSSGANASKETSKPESPTKSTKKKGSSDS